MTEDEKERIYLEVQNKKLYEMQAVDIEQVRLWREACERAKANEEAEQAKKALFAIEYYQFRKGLSFWQKFKELFR